jgi:hypothetical protein
VSWGRMPLSANDDSSGFLSVLTRFVKLSAADVSSPAPRSNNELCRIKVFIEVYQLLREPSISRISRQMAERVRTFLQSSSVISNIEIKQ